MLGSWEGRALACRIVAASNVNKELEASIEDGRKHEVLLDRGWRVHVSEARTEGMTTCPNPITQRAVCSMLTLVPRFTIDQPKTIF